jgi:hypothetical protein
MYASALPAVKNAGTFSMIHESAKNYLTGYLTKTKAPGSEPIRFLLCFFDRIGRGGRALLSTQRRGIIPMREAQ